MVNQESRGKFPGREKSIRNRLDQIRGRNESQGPDDNELKPKHVLPPPDDEAQSNYITDIGAKWHRNYFSFVSTYSCPSPNALSPTFESKFTDGTPRWRQVCPLFHAAHGESVGISDSLSVDECMKAIQDDPWFVP